MQRKYYCYALCNSLLPGAFCYGPRLRFSYEPFYIGHGCGDRSSKHVGNALRRRAGNYIDNSHKSRTIRKILRNGGDVIEIRTLNLSTKRKASFREIEIIAAIGRSDLGTGPLANHTNGGDGGLPGYKHTKAAKRTIGIKVSAALTGVSHTAARRLNNSLANKNRCFTESHKKNLRLSKINGCSEEHKAKISLANKGRPKTESTIKKLSIAMKGKPWSAARRAAQDIVSARKRLINLRK